MKNSVLSSSFSSITLSHVRGSFFSPFLSMSIQISLCLGASPSQVSLFYSAEVWLSINFNDSVCVTGIFFLTGFSSWSGGCSQSDALELTAGRHLSVYTDAETAGGGREKCDRDRGIGLQAVIRCWWWTVLLRANITAWETGRLSGCRCSLPPCPGSLWVRLWSRECGLNKLSETRNAGNNTEPGKKKKKSTEADRIYKLDGTFQLASSAFLLEAAVRSLCWLCWSAQQL